MLGATYGTLYIIKLGGSSLGKVLVLEVVTYVGSSVLV